MSTASETDTNLTLFHTTSSTPHSSPNPLLGAGIPQTTLAFLEEQHAASLAQEASIDPADVAREGFDAYMRDKHIALDQDKCWFVFQMCLALGARNVVEAGTSFGLSTIYLALALQTLSSIDPTTPRRVIATENEPSKASIARANWARAGVESTIDLREGDILQTLSKDVSTVDLLLLDIWAPLALPTLLLIEPHLRPGALVIIDNSTSSAQRYADLLAHIRAQGSGYASMTVPFPKGLEVCVWLGGKR